MSNRRMLRQALALALVLGPATWHPAAAQDCGGEVACALDDGSYHIRMPVGPAVGAVMFLHGHGGTSAATIANDSLVLPILERRYAVVAPQGLPRRLGANGGRWNSSGVPGRRDDIAFVRAALEDASDRFGFPRAQVLAAGFSAGGMMVWKIACDQPDSFAAYAPISGTLWRPMPEDCAGPVSMLHVHGWSDTVVPIEGRRLGGGRITQGDLFEGLELMRRASSCETDDPDGYGQRGDMLIRSWSECADGSRLALVLHPGGHMIPPGWGALALDWFEGGPSG